MSMVIAPYWFTAGGVFSPLDLSPALWVDPSDASTVTISGSSGAYIGAAGLVLPGGANHAEVPDSAALDITGDFEIVAKVTASDWTPAANMTIVQKGNAGGAATDAYGLRLNTSGLLEVNVTNGVSYLGILSSVATGLTDGSTKWVKATYDATNGSNSVAEFFLSDDGSTWTQLGTTQTSSVNAGIPNVSSPLYIGRYTTVQPWIGTIHRAIIKNGIGGTTVFDADFENATPFVSAFTESALGAPVYVVSSTATSATASYGYVGPNGLTLAGSGANYASAPDIAAYDLTAEAEVVVRAKLNDWTPAAASTLLSHINGVTGLALTVHTDGTLKLVTDALTATSTAATGFTDGTAYWIKATYQDSTNEVKFYTAADASTEPGSWTQLGTTVTQVSVLTASTSALFVGALASASQVCAGTIYRAILRSTIGGSSVFDADFTTAADYAASFTESSSNAATVTITATNTPANAAGALVSQINDKSGNARHLTQGTAANMPKYWNGRNGLNCLVFDGSNDYVTSPAFTLAQPLTIVTGTRHNTGTGTNVQLTGNMTTTPALYIQLNNWSLYAGSLVSGTTADANEHAMAAVFDGASSSIRRDGSVIGSGNAGASGYSAKELRIGADAPGAANWAGRVFDLFVVGSALSGGDLTNAESYIKTKWGTP